MDKGNHTWDLYVRYVRCPQCGYILESRQRTADFTCPRCNSLFKDEKRKKQTFGPLLDDKHQPSEIDWS
ncbi:MAG: hypothetical protein WC222_04545 [Parachlamydiales bacterium]